MRVLPWALLSAARLRRVAGLRECSGCHRDVLRVLAAHRHTSEVGAGEVAVETPIWTAMWALMWVPKWAMLEEPLTRLQMPSNAVNLGCLNGFLASHRWQKPRQASG